MNNFLFWGALATIASLLFFVVTVIELSIIYFFLKKHSFPNRYSVAAFIIPLQLTAGWFLADYASRGIDLAYGGGGVVLALGVIFGVFIGIVVVPIFLYMHTLVERA